MPSRGYGAPHFGPEADRVYVYASGGLFGSPGASGLISLRFDGTDRWLLMKATGPGIYFSDEPVPAADVRVSPDGAHALVHHANQLYLLRLLNPYANDLTIDIGNPSLPLSRVTDIGADFFGWSAGGAEFFWSTGHAVHSRNVADVSFEKKDDDKKAGSAEAHPDEPGDGEGQKESNGGEDSAEENATSDSENDNPQSVAENDDATTAEEDEPLLEEHESVRSRTIEIYRPRHRPEGRLALTGARILTMEEGAAPIEDGIVLIDGDRIDAVGAGKRGHHSGRCHRYRSGGQDDRPRLCRYPRPLPPVAPRARYHQCRFPGEPGVRA